MLRDPWVMSASILHNIARESPRGWPDPFPVVSGTNMNGYSDKGSTAATQWPRSVPCSDHRGSLLRRPALHLFIRAPPRLHREAVAGPGGTGATPPGPGHVGASPWTSPKFGSDTSGWPQLGYTAGFESGRPTNYPAYGASRGLLPPIPWLEIEVCPPVPRVQVPGDHRPGRPCRQTRPTPAHRSSAHTDPRSFVVDLPIPKPAPPAAAPPTGLPRPLTHVAQGCPSFARPTALPAHSFYLQHLALQVRS